MRISLVSKAVENCNVRISLVLKAVENDNVPISLVLKAGKNCNMRISFLLHGSTTCDVRIALVYRGGISKMPWAHFINPRVGKISISFVLEVSVSIVFENHWVWATPSVLNSQGANDIRSLTIGERKPQGSHLIISNLIQ